MVGKSLSSPGRTAPCCRHVWLQGRREEALLLEKEDPPLMPDKGQSGMKENGEQFHCATSAFAGPCQTSLLIHLNQAHS